MDGQDNLGQLFQFHGGPGYDPGANASTINAAGAAATAAAQRGLQQKLQRQAQLQALFQQAAQIAASTISQNRQIKAAATEAQKSRDFEEQIRRSELDARAEIARSQQAAQRRVEQLRGFGGLLEKYVTEGGDPGFALDTYDQLSKQALEPQTPLPPSGAPRQAGEPTPPGPLGYRTALPQQAEDPLALATRQKYAGLQGEGGRFSGMPFQRKKSWEQIKYEMDEEKRQAVDQATMDLFVARSTGNKLVVTQVPLTLQDAIPSLKGKDDAELEQLIIKADSTLAPTTTKEGKVNRAALDARIRMLKQQYTEEAPNAAGIRTMDWTGARHDARVFVGAMTQTFGEDFAMNPEAIPVTPEQQRAFAAKNLLKRFPHHQEFFNKIQLQSNVNTAPFEGRSPGPVVWNKDFLQGIGVQVSQLPQELQWAADMGLKAFADANGKIKFENGGPQIDAALERWQQTDDGLARRALAQMTAGGARKLTPSELNAGANLPLPPNPAPVPPRGVPPSIGLVNRGTSPTLRQAPAPSPQSVGNKPGQGPSSMEPAPLPPAPRSESLDALKRYREKAQGKAPAAKPSPPKVKKPSNAVPPVASLVGRDENVKPGQVPPPKTKLRQPPAPKKENKEAEAKRQADELMRLLTLTPNGLARGAFQYGQPAVYEALARALGGSTIPPKRK